MNCNLLTKEEIIRGERIFRQLEKVEEEILGVEWYDIIDLLLCIKLEITSDWKETNIVGKLGIIIVYSPIVYVLLNAFYIINC